MRLIVYSSNSNLNSIYFSEKKAVNPKLNQMILKCSNPLLKDTKECVALWNQLDNFNKQIDILEYSIKHLDITKNNNFIFDGEYTEVSRIYED